MSYSEIWKEYEKNWQEWKEKLLSNYKVLKSENATDSPLRQPQSHIPRSDNDATPQPTHINYNYDSGFSYFIQCNWNTAPQRLQHGKIYQQSYHHYPS